MSTGTRSEWRIVAAELRAAGTPHWEIASALRARFKLGALQAMRCAHGWSQTQAADRWTELFHDQPKTFKDVSKWETDRHTPPLPTLDKLARVYSCDLDDLLADRPGYRPEDAALTATTPEANRSAAPSMDEREGPSTALDPVPGDSVRDYELARSDSRCAEVGSDTAAVLNPVALLHESQELDVEALASLIVMSAQRARLALGRREVLSKLSAAIALAAAAPVFNPGVSLSGDEQRRVERALDEPGRLDAATLEHTESIILALRHQADLLGPQAPLQAAMSQRSLLGSVLPEAPAPVRSQATAVYAEICQLAGWLLFNSGDYRSAMVYYDEARTLAHEADDIELATYVLCTMSHLATWCGRPGVGIDHAVAATNWANQIESAYAQAYAADVSVRAYVAAGDRTASESALEQERAAFAVVGRGDVRSRDGVRSWWYFFGECFPLGTEAQYALRFRETDRAHRVIGRSLELVDKGNLHDYAFQLLLRAEAFAQGGEVAEACALLGDVAELTASNTSRRVNQQIWRLRDLLAAQSDSQAVLLLDERLASAGHARFGVTGVA